MKKQRQNAIRNLIENQCVRTQEELTSLLKKMGIAATQATVSRDIKELKLVKAASGAGETKYILPTGNVAEGFTPKLQAIFRECVTKVDLAGNLIVVRTMGGMANAAAFGIDAIKDGDIVGSIAGDDTVFLAVRTLERAEAIYIYLNELINKR